MTILKNNLGLYTDHYELTMAQGYFLSGKQNIRANFDYFFRKNPFNGGYVIFTGLADLLDTIENYRFSDEDCRYLESVGFDKRFVEYLRDFKFGGGVYSVREGEIIFPNEPAIRVEGNIIETQLIESLLLNIVNFQSLIATKAARIRFVAGDKQLVDFGLRRAQGLGAIHASRAAMIGGFDSSSNIYSAYKYGFTSTGTMAHSWIQAFDDELLAFQEFVRYYPESAILLVDTYDTLNSGMPNAIKVAKQLEQEGKKLMGIRLDSGDLALLSKTARKMLDKEKLEYVKIVVSNQLDEYLIRSLLEQKAPIDAFGVGTSLVIGRGEGALDGVYKLTHIDNRPTMKLSENASKMTLPGKKSIYRFINPENNLFCFDGVELQDKGIPENIYYAQQLNKAHNTEMLQAEEIISKVMENGKTQIKKFSIKDITKFSQNRLKQLGDEMKRFENPHIYTVGLGKELISLSEKLKKEIL